MFTHQQLVGVLIIQYHQHIVVIILTVIQLPEELVTQQFHHFITDKLLEEVVKIQHQMICHLLGVEYVIQQ
jgi:hypothetical protein